MGKKYKEPIQFKFMWLILVVIVLIGVPWYFPKGAIHPIVLGFPLWAFISLLASIALSIFLGYFINNCWDMEKLKEKKAEENQGGAQ